MRFYDVTHVCDDSTIWHFYVPSQQEVNSVIYSNITNPIIIPQNVYTPNKNRCRTFFLPGVRSSWSSSSRGALNVVQCNLFLDIKFNVNIHFSLFIIFCMGMSRKNLPFVYVYNGRVIAPY